MKNKYAALSVMFLGLSTPSAGQDGPAVPLPPLAPPGPAMHIGMHDSFLSACSDDLSRQVVFPLAMEYGYPQDVSSRGVEIPNVVAARIQQTLENVVERNDILTIIEHGLGRDVVLHGQIHNYIEGMAAGFGGWIDILPAGDVVFATGCNLLIDEGWYATHLAVQNEVRDILAHHRKNPVIPKAQAPKAPV